MTLEAAADAVLRVAQERAPHGAAYLDTRLYRAGESLSIDRQAYVVDVDTFMGFVDPAPSANWAHPCLYVLCRSGGAGPEVREGSFPPYFEAVSPTLRLVWCAPGVDERMLPTTTPLGPEGS